MVYFLPGQNRVLTSLNVLTGPWPFSMWGIDVIEVIETKASNRHHFILVAIDYFTKWVEPASYANVTKKVVAKFIRKELICRYGLPSRIITDNAINLNNKMMSELCEEFKIQHHNSSPYRSKMNRAIEAANKNIKKTIQKMVITYKDWHEMLSIRLAWLSYISENINRSDSFLVGLRNGSCTTI